MPRRSKFNDSGLVPEGVDPLGKWTNGRMDYCLYFRGGVKRGDWFMTDEVAWIWVCE